MNDCQSCLNKWKDIWVGNTLSIEVGLELC